MELVRYENRKLYSKKLKRYVSLPELNGIDFKVTCKKTGEDVTKRVAASLAYKNAIKELNK